MVQITERPSAELRRLLFDNFARPQQGVRLRLNHAGGLAMAIDVPRSGAGAGRWFHIELARHPVHGLQGGRHRLSMVRHSKPQMGICRKCRSVRVLVAGLCRDCRAADSRAHTPAPPPDSVPPQGST